MEIKYSGKGESEYLSKVARESLTEKVIFE